MAKQVTVTELLGAFSDKVLLEIRFIAIIPLVVKMVLFLKSPNAGSWHVFVCCLTLVFNQTLKFKTNCFVQRIISRKLHFLEKVISRKCKKDIVVSINGLNARGRLDLNLD